MRSHAWQSVLCRWILILFNSWMKWCNPKQTHSSYWEYQACGFMHAVVVCVCICTLLLYFGIWILECKMYSYHENSRNWKLYLLYFKSVQRESLREEHLNVFLLSTNWKDMCVHFGVHIQLRFFFLSCILGTVVCSSIYQYLVHLLDALGQSSFFFTVFLDYH